MIDFSSCEVEKTKMYDGLNGKKKSHLLLNKILLDKGYQATSKHSVITKRR